MIPDEKNSTMKSTSKRTIQQVLALAAIGSLSLLISCSKPAGENEIPSSDSKTLAHKVFKQELVRGGASEPKSLDPQIGYGTEMFILRDLHEGLVESGPDGKTIPAVAERWESDDNRVYRFYLRENAKWSNGDPVTAEDFVFSWRRLVSPDTGSKYSWYLEAAGVQNAGDVIKGDKPPESLGVRSIDDRILEVTLERPLTYFVDMLVHASTYPLHPSTVNKHGSNWPRLGTHIGNGAFQISDWVVNEKIVLTRNPFYWNSGSVKIQKVTYLPISDAQAEIARYMAGDLDINYQLNYSQVKNIYDSLQEDVNISPMLGTRTLQFNTKSPPLNDLRLRKALSLSIDRELIVKKVTRMGEIPSFTLTPLNIDGIADPELSWAQWSQAERENEARKLYSEAGYSLSNPLKLRLLYATGGKTFPLAVSAMWKRVLGAEVTLENTEFSVFIQNLEKSNYQTASVGWIGDYAEPSTMLNAMRGGAGTNFSGFSKTEYDEILNKAASEVDPGIRAQLYAEAERLLATYVPISPIYQFTNARLVKPYVNGYSDHPMMLLPSKNLWISEND